MLQVIPRLRDARSTNLAALAQLEEASRSEREGCGCESFTRHHFRTSPSAKQLKRPHSFDSMRQPYTGFWKEPGMSRWKRPAGDVLIFSGAWQKSDAPALQ